MQFRNGQWLKFDGRGAAEFKDAFHARDGKVVGIFREGDDFGSFKVEPSIAIVSSKGENMDIVSGGMTLPVKVGMNQPGIEPVTDREDIPFERIKHLPKTWNPRP